MFWCLIVLIAYADDMDLPQPDSEIGEILWVVVLHGNGHFSVEFELWALNNLLAVFVALFGS